MRRLLLLASIGALLASPPAALAQALTYSSGQGGVVGTVTAATSPNGSPLRVVLPAIQVGRGVSSTLDITAATLVAAGPHRVANVCVITAGSAAGTLNDSATTGAAATANEVYSIPNTAGCVALDWPMSNGIVVVPGSGQAVSVSYN